MPLTLAGVPLTVDAALEDAATALLDPWDASETVWDDWGGPWGDLHGLPRHRWPGRASGVGALNWPCWGLSRWATGHFLAHAEAATAIRAAYVASASGGGDGSMELLLAAPDLSPGREEGNAGVALTVVPLPPRRIAGPDLPVGSEATTRGAYLVSVVDRRYFLRSRSVRPDLDLDLGCGATWHDLYNALIADAGIAMTFDKVDEAYLVPPASLAALAGTNVALALDAVASSVGQRIVANHDGTFHARDAGKALEARDQDDADAAALGRRRLGGGDLFEAIL